MTANARFCLACGRDFTARTSRSGVDMSAVYSPYEPPIYPAPSVCPECWTDPAVRDAAARLDATIESILRTYERR